MAITHILLTVALLSNPSPDDGDPLQQALDVLAKVDAARLAVDYRGESLQQVLADLGPRIPVPLRADWDALRRMGVTDDDRVDYRVSGATGSAVLAGLAMSLGDELERPVFESYAGQIILTTRRATESMRLTALYDVRDLIANAPLVQRLREEAPRPDAGTSMPADQARKDQEAPERDKEPRAIPAPGQKDLPGHRNPLGELPETSNRISIGESAPQTAGEQLINLVTDHVDPDAWMNFGGSRAKISDQNGVLIVTATASTHWQLKTALRRLREATSNAVRVQAAIVDLPREKFESLSRQFDRHQNLLASAILADSSSTLLWRTADPATANHPLAIESRSGDAEVRIKLTPTVDAQTGVCLVVVEGSTAGPNDRRSVNTRISLAGDDRGAILELPALKPSNEIRLIVVLIDRG